MLVLLELVHGCGASEQDKLFASALELLTRYPEGFFVCKYLSLDAVKGIKDKLEAVVRSSNALLIAVELLHTGESFG